MARIRTFLALLALLLVGGVALAPPAAAETVSTTLRAGVAGLPVATEIRTGYDRVNQAKGDQDPATWMPSYGPARCRYVGEWLAVKLRWRLTVDTAERNALVSLANACPNVTITVTRAI